MTEQELQTLMHDMRGELTVLKNGFAFILEGRTGDVTEKTKEFLEEMNKRNENLIKLTFKYKQS